MVYTWYMRYKNSLICNLHWASLPWWTSYNLRVLSTLVVRAYCPVRGEKNAPRTPFDAVGKRTTDETTLSSSSSFVVDVLRKSNIPTSLERKRNEWLSLWRTITQVRKYILPVSVAHHKLIFILRMETDRSTTVSKTLDGVLNSFWGRCANVNNHNASVS